MERGAVWWQRSLNRSKVQEMQLLQSPESAKLVSQGSWSAADEPFEPWLHRQVDLWAWPHCSHKSRVPNKTQGRMGPPALPAGRCSQLLVTRAPWCSSRLESAVTTLFPRLINLISFMHLVSCFMFGRSLGERVAASSNAQEKWSECKGWVWQNVPYLHGWPKTPVGSNICVGSVCPAVRTILNALNAALK